MRLQTEQRQRIRREISDRARRKALTNPHRNTGQHGLAWRCYDAAGGDALDALILAIDNLDTIERYHRERTHPPRRKEAAPC